MVDAWIAFWQAGKNSPEREANKWADSLLFELLTVDDKPELVWQFILEACKRDLSDKLISLLGAGPVEDLLARYGPDYIERIETLARQNPKFNHVLGGVWKNAIKEEIWLRVLASRKGIW